MRRALLATAVLGLAAIAGAQEAPPTVGLPSDSPIPPNPYEGVTPGTDNPPPRLAQIEHAGRTLVTWPGFQMTSGGSRIFVETSGPVTFQETRGRDRFVVLLRNCKIHTRNNKNPLVTRHFNTPVSQAYLVPHRRDVELVLELRAQVTPAISQTDGPNGFRFLFVDLPGGSFLPPGADEEPVPSWQEPSSPSESEPADQSPEPMEPGGAGPTP